MATLDLRALDTRLKSKKLDRVHLFVGEDVKLIDRYVDAIEATVDEADRPFAVERVYAGDAGGTPVEIASAARIFPMLGDRRIVIVLRAERFLKPKRAAKASEADAVQEDAEGADPIDLSALDAYLDEPVESTTLVFVSAGIDRTRKFTKRLYEKASVTEFAGLMVDAGGRRDVRQAVVEQIRRELADQQRSIDARALSVLVERAGGDISRLRDDVERLVLYTEGRTTISIDDVNEIVVDHTSVKDEFAVINAIAAGDAGRALREAAARLDRGDSPHALVGLLRWWVSTRLAETDGRRVRPALDALLRTDLALKSSGGDERVLVERLIVELTGKPLPDRRWGAR